MLLLKQYWSILFNKIIFTLKIMKKKTKKVAKKGKKVAKKAKKTSKRRR